MRVYGYARVSTREQNAERQIAALCAAGVERSNIVVEHKGGANFERPEWKKLKRRLRHGDILIMQSLDRFGRSYKEIRDEWASLVKRKHVHIKILDMKLLDTTNAPTELTGQLLADIVFSLLAYFAESERNIMLERQRQGIVQAHKRGVKFGRKLIRITAQRREIVRKANRHEITARTGAKECGVAMTTFYRWKNIVKRQDEAARAKEARNGDERTSKT